MKKKGFLEFTMTILLLAGAFFLPRESAQMIQSAATDPITVLIDVGHGGADSGKVGVNGALEKDINLQISLRLQSLLREAGINALLTRDTDKGLYQETDSNKKFADMKARIQMMTDVDADIVVSIHQNSYSKSSVSGAQVFYYTSSDQGEQLAQAIQDGFDYALGDRNTRSIKANKDYYILVHSPIVSVICECGFLSNPEEADLLTTSDYQQKIAQSICNGILNYFKNSNSSTLS